MQNGTGQSVRPARPLVQSILWGFATFALSVVVIADPLARKVFGHAPIVALAPPVGTAPEGGLVFGPDGALYGATAGGGGRDGGVLFKLRPASGTLKVLHEFGVQPADGMWPESPVTFGSDGALYGTTPSGGRFKYGTLFRLDVHSGTYTILHNFGDGAEDGRNPLSGLVSGRDGALYGTTYAGGVDGVGTIFRISESRSAYSLLQTFRRADGGGHNPAAGLTVGLDGALYGTTVFGGAAKGGTVFRVSRQGREFLVLHSFGTTPGDGRSCRGDLLAGTGGVLYGLTSDGGGPGYQGIVFRVTEAGRNYTVLHRFLPSEGHSPRGCLALGPGGVLYGTAPEGGLGGGTVFSLRQDGSNFMVLYAFGNGQGDGARPGANLVTTSTGQIYGSTAFGGLQDGGTVFSLTPSTFSLRPLWLFALCILLLLGVSKLCGELAGRVKPTSRRLGNSRFAK